MRRMWRSDVSASASAPVRAPPLILAPARTPARMSCSCSCFGSCSCSWSCSCRSFCSCANERLPAQTRCAQPDDESIAVAVESFSSRERSLCMRSLFESNQSNRYRPAIASRAGALPKQHSASKKRSCSCSWACPWFCSCSCSCCPTCLARTVHMPSEFSCL